MGRGLGRMGQTAVPKGTDSWIIEGPDRCPYSCAARLCLCPFNIFILGLVKTPLGAGDTNSIPTGLRKIKKKGGGFIG